MAEPAVEPARIRGGHYEGPEAQLEAPWKCPACGVHNEGRLALGCTSCGSGKPGVHVGIQQPRVTAAAIAAAQQGGLHHQRPIENQGLIEVAFRSWLTSHADRDNVRRVENESLVARAFYAGWQAAQGVTLQAPPVTADVATLAPEGKPRRTIVAALTHFKEHVLQQAEEEIASGEWCSIAEVETLIAQLEAEEGS